jgi:putrescine transport system ATP-binding protein
LDKANLPPSSSERPWEDADASPFIQIQGLSKHFGEFVAVDEVSLDIFQGELFSILGASGSGKTTLLRMLAGFEIPNSGTITIDGTDVTALAPYERPVNMMFQSYALFPHMSVAQNVAYGLKKDGIPTPEVNSRVEQMLESVQLSEFAKRRPHQLSGGQSQRVALARALVKRPKVLLLDEPLAALDKKLREHTQFELMNIQDELGVTFVVVTHDQEEAMTLSTRVAVMNEGRFVQVGTPRQIYEYPQTRFIADFVGNINLFEGTVQKSTQREVTIACNELAINLTAPYEHALAIGELVCFAVRPEKIFIGPTAPENAEHSTVKGVVGDLGYFGNLSIYRVKTDSGKIIQVSAQNRHRSAERVLEWDDEVYLSWDTASTVVLDR